MLYPRGTGRRYGVREIFSLHAPTTANGHRVAIGHFIPPGDDRAWLSTGVQALFWAVDGPPHGESFYRRKKEKRYVCHKPRLYRCL